MAFVAHAAIGVAHYNVSEPAEGIVGGTTARKLSERIHRSRAPAASRAGCHRYRRYFFEFEPDKDA
jgi:hypothetical protein